jgi:hypothetical protein
MVCLAQTAHLSCSDTNTVSKRTGTRFHMSHVTYEFHRVRSKRYPSLWNIRRKPYSYLASRLVLYENRSKWVSTWAMSPRRTSSVSKWFLGLAKTVHLSYTNPNTVSKWHNPHHLGVPSGVTKMISKPMVRSALIMHLSCVKSSTISKQTETSFHLRLVTSEYHWVRPKRLLSLWFGANRAPILLRHWHRHGMERNKTPHEPQNPGVPLASSETIFKPMFGTNRAPILHQDWHT